MSRHMVSLTQKEGKWEIAETHCLNAGIYLLTYLGPRVFQPLGKNVSQQITLYSSSIRDTSIVRDHGPRSTNSYA